MKPLSLLLLLALSFISLAPGMAESPTAAANAPLAAVQQTVNTVIDIVESMPKEEQREARRTKLTAAIAPRFDFAEMSKRSLGTFWAECTPEQQREFVEVFSKLLSSTYISRIEAVKRDTVTYKGESIDPPKATVKTLVTNKGDSFPIDYRLMQISGDWKVYDVVIENVGLVANYRNEFAGIIRKEKFDGLMKRLREKSVS